MESEFRAFNYSVLSDSLANKGVLYTKIRIRNSYVNIFNTHLQASYFDSEVVQWNSSVKTRMDQIDEIRDFIIEISERDMNIKDNIFLILGDFNCDAHMYERKRAVSLTSNMTRL